LGQSHHIYNSDETGTSDITQYMSGDVWVNQDLDSISYDATGREAIDLLLVWINVAWVPGTHLRMI
jgi:hypothetical protein